MKYYIVDCISGCKEGARAITDLDKARAKRDRMNERDKKKGHSGELWIIVDENGSEVV